MGRKVLTACILSPELAEILEIPGNLKSIEFITAYEVEVERPTPEVKNIETGSWDSSIVEHLSSSPRSWV
jgi:hypothetical protein